MILVVGAGIGGLTLAAGLQQAGLDYRVFEAADRFDEVGASIKVWPNGMRGLREVGAAEAVEGAGVTIRRGEILAPDGTQLTETPLDRLGLEAPLVSLHRAELHRALASCVPDRRIETGRRAVDVAEGDGSVELQFEAGESAAGELVVVADGLDSGLRSRLFPDYEVEYAGRISWLTTVPFEDGNWSRHESHEIQGRGRRFGWSFIDDETVGWYANYNAAEDFRPDGDLREDLRERFAGWPEPVGELIELSESTEIIRTPIYFGETLEQWGRGRVGLLGDAAHPMTPDLAQGACQAIEDAAVLVDELAEAVSPAALRRYADRRRPRAEEVSERSEMLGRISNWQSRIACWVRKKMFQWTPERVGHEQFRELVSYDFLA